ncbi:MAG: autotransporter outer membrane beta-barrel domain-containing protein [Pseudomonadales bacterium]
MAFLTQRETSFAVPRTVATLPFVVVLTGLMLTGLTPGFAQAANPGYQAFFFDVCRTPTGALADRCGETPGNLGGLSGNSQNSLNPTQGLALPSTLEAGGSARDRQLRSEQDSAAPALGFAVDQGPVSLLLNVRAGWDSLDRAQGTPSTRGFDAERYGVEAGLDWRASERWVLGVLAAYEQSTLEFGPGAPGVNFTPVASSGSIESASRTLIAYADWTFGTSAYLDLLVSFSDDDLEFERNAEFQETRRVTPQVAVRTRGDTAGSRSSAAVVVGSEIARGALSLGYFAGLTATRVTVDGFAERDKSSSGLAMRFDDVDQDAVFGHVGLALSRSVPFAGGVLLPQLRLEHQLTLESDRTAGAASFILDPSATLFEFSGEPVDHNQTVLAAGVTGVLPNGWLPFVNLESVFGIKDLSQYRVVLGLRREW